MEREAALQIWDAIFGNKDWAVDCFGTWMFRDDYGDQERERLRPNGDGKMHSYGWEIDHLRPKSDFPSESDADFLNNYEPMHWQNNRTKSDLFPHFWIEDRQYRIVKCSICSAHGFKGYGLIDETDARIDWKGRQNKFFPTNR